MGKINLLSFEVANLIAAGEVVERPSSVLKELIENSIDSGATRIVAEIKHGGVALIRVTDDGCGMDKEDLPIALKRHATSKIKGKDDLDSIMTLGFRGEALAAIASVSNLTVITKTKTAPVASMLVAEAGNVVDISEVGASDGTTVVVENLFFNVPARRKFLKKDSTEAMNVAALVERVALSRPDISIQLLIDGEEKFKTPGNSKLIDTIYAIYGKQFVSRLIEVRSDANGIEVHGYIGRSDNVKKNRNLQNVFINGRYVKSMTVMAAIEKGYTSYIAPECFPVCVLFLNMNPQAVDVNVHPAKLEVKFADERAVFETVYYTVKSALEEYEYRPEMTLTQNKRVNPLSAFVPIGDGTRAEQIRISGSGVGTAEQTRIFGSGVGTAEQSSQQRQSAATNLSHPTHSTLKAQPQPRVTYDMDTPIRLSSPAERERVATQMTPSQSLEMLKRYGSAAPNSRRAADADLPPEPAQARESIGEPSLPEYKIIGEAFNCYVLVECGAALLMIDKHAAHERIIFEELKKKCEAESGVALQNLLLPITVLLTPEESAALREYESEMRTVGFEFSLADSSCDLLAVPSAIGIADAEGLFIQMLDEIACGVGKPEITAGIRREKALYQIACKAAIKGGRVYDSSLITWLVERVLQLPDITVCPHGRPIAYRLTKNELDKQFDRIK